jgi:hypothetical protein
MGLNLKAAALATLVAMMPLSAHAVEQPIDLTWAKLVPDVPKKEPPKLKSFLSGATPSPFSPQGPDAVPPPTANDQPWMSQKSLQPGRGASPVVEELNGKRVRLGGYVVPLEFDSTTVKEFLLVPFVGACIHVPPPPPNQIVYVKSEKGIDVSGSFDPVWVTGTLKTAAASTGLADTGYTLEADTVAARKD